MATRAEIKLRARRRADMENSTFIGDAELTEYFQASYGELYDLLVKSFEDYYSKSLAFTIASGATSYTVPADFYKLRGIDLIINTGNIVTLGQFNFAERNRAANFTGRTIFGNQNTVYRLMGQSILILPATAAPGNYTLWYIPRVTATTGDVDSIGDVLDFEEYIVIDMALKMVAKQEDDISALALAKAEMRSRVLEMAQDRDTGAPQTIQDVTRSEWDDNNFPR